LLFQLIGIRLFKGFYRGAGPAGFEGGAIAYAVQDWLKDLEIEILYIKPGSPWENAYIESFHLSVPVTTAEPQRAGFRS
jgi:transposase InsO family protein